MIDTHAPGGYPRGMTHPSPRKPARSGAQIFFAAVAISTGTIGFLQAGMRGHGAGWEEMMIYTVPAVVCALLAIAIRRNTLGVVALLFGGLGVVGFMLGA